MGKQANKNKSARRRKRQQRAAQKKTKLNRAGFELQEYEIVFDPIEDPYASHLSKEEDEELNEIYHQLNDSPDHCVEVLERLREKHPGVPRIYNYLSAAYSAIGDTEQAEAFVVDTYERFPEYLFGRVNYAIHCLRIGRTDEVPKIFGGHFSLCRIYPSRRGRFHVTEFVQFSAVMGLYFCKIGKRDVAQSYLSMAKDVAPDHHLVHELERRLSFMSFFGKFFPKATRDQFF